MQIYLFILHTTLPNFVETAQRIFAGLSNGTGELRLIYVKWNCGFHFFSLRQVASKPALSSYLSPDTYLCRIPNIVVK